MFNFSLALEHMKAGRKVETALWEGRKYAQAVYPKKGFPEKPYFVLVYRNAPGLVEIWRPTVEELYQDSWFIARDEEEKPCP